MQRRLSQSGISLKKALQPSGLEWGSAATKTTSVLVCLIIFSLVAPELSSYMLSKLFQITGGLFIVAYVIYSVPFIRYNLLRVMLKWRGWAYSPRSTMSSIFLGVVGVLGGSHPKLFALQPTLPTLPVPKLDDTLRKYLRSVKPLLSEEEYAETERKVKIFAQKEGPVLQKILEQRAATVSPNWLLEWWENLIYLKSRLNLPIFSNWYGLDRIDPILKSQEARAANLVHGLLSFKRLLDTQQLEPNRVQGTVPLCMMQYSRIFGTVRIPHEEQDVLEYHPNSTFIVVESRGVYFKVEMYDKEGLLPPTDIQTQLRRILEVTADIKYEDQPAISQLTSLNRTQWAKHRNELMEMDPTNKKSLSAIESALFVLHLDEDAPATVEEMMPIGMHRHGRPLWFDKNFNLTVCKNGRLACNVDHTWADASVIVHVYDYVFSVESSVDHYIDKLHENPKLPKPEKLDWVVTKEFEPVLQEGLTTAVGLSQKLDMYLLKFQIFGKGLIKKLSMSPDAFCQMALQLAYYRIHQSCALTYETGGTVRFFCSRTETVRSCSVESRAFCEAMCDENRKPDEKLKALRAAVKQHVRYMRMATNGDGIDRHLFGLRVLAAGAQMEPELFGDKSMQLSFKLSTSQTPATGMLGGGFAPLAEDGYSSSYVVAEDRLWFHIATYAECPITSAKNFGNELSKALLDMHDMCFQDPQLQKKMSQRVYHIMRAE